MITPFDDRGQVDLEGAVSLARHLVANGSDGLVVAGTTGEGPVLTDEEKVELWEVIAESVSAPMIAGTGSFDTAHAAALTRAAKDAGAAAALVVTPYYNRPSQAGLAEHFRAVADSCDLPILLYDIPVRTGRRIDPELVLTLSREVPGIVGIKDAAGDPAGTARVVAETPASFDVYCGDDALTLPLLAVGAVGVVSVASHWAGPSFRELVAAFDAGDMARARAVNTRLLPSYRFQSTEEYPNPVPAKAVCRALGLPAGQCRLPHPVAPASLQDQAQALLAQLASEPVRQSVA